MRRLLPLPGGEVCGEVCGEVFREHLTIRNTHKQRVLGRFGEVLGGWRAYNNRKRDLLRWRLGVEG